MVSGLFTPAETSTEHKTENFRVRGPPEIHSALCYVYSLKMNSWVLLQNQFMGDAELMLVPAVATLEKPKRLKRIVYLFSDVVYYTARFLLVSKFL